MDIESLLRERAAQITPTVDDREALRRTLARVEITVERWWNSAYGHLARMDLWLKRWDGPTRSTWRVEAQRGGPDGRWWASVDLDTEDKARAVLERIKARRPGQWQLLAPS